VVVTGGSNLYPPVRAELWPAARHQLCAFPALKELHKHALDAVRRLRRGLSRRGNWGRKRKPGRRPRGRAPTNKEESAFVFRHRWPVVRRRDKMSDQEQAALATMLSYLPELRAVWDFVDRLGMLFEDGRGEALAWGRHAAPAGDRSSPAVPELAKAFEALSAEQFAKMIASLKNLACRRVRTNDHVERVDRGLRYEKARYKRRERRPTVRSLVLPLDRSRRQGRAIRGRWPDEAGGGQPGGSSRSPRECRVA
jgi:hypothetical protein